MPRPVLGPVLFFWVLRRMDFFFLRKISPELTTASPPHFLLRKPGPELTPVPIFLYFIRGTLSTAWLLPSSAMSAPGIQTSEPGAAEAELAH